MPTLTRRRDDGFDEFYNPPRLSKPEVHLLLKPFFVLDRNADRMKPIEYVSCSKDGQNQVARGWCVEPHSKYGLPGPVDRDVVIGLYEIANEEYLSRGLLVPDRMPFGSWRRFLNRLGLKPTGPTLREIKIALKRLQHTLCTCEQTFFDNTRQIYVSTAFTLIKALGFVGEQVGNGTVHEYNFVVFNESILANLNTGYVLVLDVDYMRGLKTQIARLLYAHLSYRFYIAQQEGLVNWVVDYSWLTTHLGIKRYGELWRAKGQLKEAHDELVSTGYIKQVQWHDWKIVYSPGPVWCGEQLRRKSGRVAHLTEKANSTPRVSILEKQVNETNETETPNDLLIPVLAAFANNLPFAHDLLREKGLTPAQAELLCQQRNIALRR